MNKKSNSFNRQDAKTPRDFRFSTCQRFASLSNRKSQIANRKLFHPWCLGVLAVPFLISGCLVGPNYKKPDTSMPQSWLPPTSQPTTQQSIATNEPAQVQRWWTSFNDPMLDSLVREALQSNLDLKQAEMRLREARASRGIAAAPLYPSVNSTGSYTRAGNVEVSHDLYQLGLDANWEIDIFGGLQRGVEASTANLQAAIEDFRDVQVTLTSEVALDYLDLRSFQRQIVIANENLDSQRRTLDLTKRVFRAGFTGGLDVANAEAQVATTESQIPSLESAARQSMYALAVLLGRQPADLVDQLNSPAPIPATPPVIPVGLPSDLLRRRPDVRRAEAQLHAATANVGVATSDLFPKFSLTGTFGYESGQLKQLLNRKNLAWSVGPAISWPIFEGGQIQYNIELQKALQQETFFGYQKTVLTALQDVESSLIAYEKEQVHRESLIAAVNANRRAVDLSTQLYTEGQTDFLNVLSAQRSLLATQDALVQSDLAIATDLVSLYKALGGGWEEVPPR
jgi:multidrug efflux system outer membrane protein